MIKEIIRPAADPSEKSFALDFEEHVIVWLHDTFPKTFHEAVGNSLGSAVSVIVGNIVQPCDGKVRRPGAAQFIAVTSIDRRNKLIGTSTVLPEQHILAGSTFTMTAIRMK